MSMIGYFRLVPPDVPASLVGMSEDDLAGFLFPDDEAPDTVDVDKAWHGLHFLLAGSDEAPDAAAQAVLGGSEIGPDLGYGPLRHLPQAETRDVADALELIDRTTLLAHYDAAKMNQEAVYPQIWDEEDADILEYLGVYYDKVRDLYLSGRERGLAMLLWLG